MYTYRCPILFVPSYYPSIFLISPITFRFPIYLALPSYMPFPFPWHLVSEALLESPGGGWCGLVPEVANHLRFRGRYLSRRRRDLDEGRRKAERSISIQLFSAKKDIHHRCLQKNQCHQLDSYHRCLISTKKLSGVPFKRQRFLAFGAGRARWSPSG